MLKTTKNCARASISIKLTKICKENQGRNVFYIREYDFIEAGSKLCNVIFSWQKIKTPQSSAQGSFSIKSLKLCHKNKSDILASGPLYDGASFYYPLSIVDASSSTSCL